MGSKSVVAPGEPMAQSKTKLGVGKVLWNWKESG